MRPRRTVPSNAQTARASAEIFLLLFPTSHYQLPTNHSIFNYFRTLCQQQTPATPFPPTTSALFASQWGVGGRSLNVQTFQLATFQRSLSPLECAVPRFRLLTPLECAVTKTRSPKSFRMRSSEKKWGEGLFRVHSPATCHSLLATIFSRFPGRLGRRACRLVHGLKCRLHPVDTALEVFGMLVQVHEEALDVEGRASPLAKRRRQRWSARTARRGNLIVQVHRIHAPARQSLVRILHQPTAIVPVENHAGGDHDPLSPIFRRRLLTIPEPRLRHEHGGIRKPVLIQGNPLEAVLFRKTLHFGEGLVPIHIGVVHQGVSRPAHAQRIDEGKVVRISAHRREKATCGKDCDCGTSQLHPSGHQWAQFAEHPRHRSEQQGKQHQGHAEMTDADAKGTNQAEKSRHKEADPKYAPVRLYLLWDRRTAGAPFSDNGNQYRERKQNQKRKRRFQRKNDRKVKPHAMRVAAPENKRRPHSGD